MVEVRPSKVDTGDPHSRYEEIFRRGVKYRTDVVYTDPKTGRQHRVKGVTGTAPRWESVRTELRGRTEEPSVDLSPREEARFQEAYGIARARRRPAEIPTDTQIVVDPRSGRTEIVRTTPESERIIEAGRRQTLQLRQERVLADYESDRMQRIRTLAGQVGFSGVEREGEELVFYREPVSIKEPETVDRFTQVFEYPLGEKQRRPMSEVVAEQQRIKFERIKQGEITPALSPLESRRQFVIAGITRGVKDFLHPFGEVGREMRKEIMEPKRDLLRTSLGPYDPRFLPKTKVYAGAAVAASTILGKTPLPVSFIAAVGAFEAAKTATTGMPPTPERVIASTTTVALFEGTGAAVRMYPALKDRFMIRREGGITELYIRGGRKPAAFEYSTPSGKAGVRVMRIPRDYVPPKEIPPFVAPARASEPAPQGEVMRDVFLEGDMFRASWKELREEKSIGEYFFQMNKKASQRASNYAELYKTRLEREIVEKTEPLPKEERLEIYEELYPGRGTRLRVDLAERYLRGEDINEPIDLPRGRMTLFEAATKMFQSKRAGIRSKPRKRRISKAELRKRSYQQAYDPRQFIDVQKAEAGIRIRSKELKERYGVKERVIRKGITGDVTIIDKGLFRGKKQALGTRISDRGEDFFQQQSPPSYKRPKEGQRVSEMLRGGRDISKFLESGKGLKGFVVVNRKLEKSFGLNIKKREPQPAPKLPKPMITGSAVVGTIAKEKKPELLKPKDLFAGDVKIQKGFRRGMYSRYMTRLGPKKTESLARIYGRYPAENIFTIYEEEYAPRRNLPAMLGISRVPSQSVGAGRMVGTSNRTVAGYSTRQIDVLRSMNIVSSKLITGVTPIILSSQSTRTETATMSLPVSRTAQELDYISPQKLDYREPFPSRPNIEVPKFPRRPEPPRYDPPRGERRRLPRITPPRITTRRPPRRPPQPPPPPRTPPRLFPKFQIKRKKKPSKTMRLMLSYQPSLVAVGEKLTGKKPEILSGLGIRPL